MKIKVWALGSALLLSVMCIASWAGCTNEEPTVDSNVEIQRELEGIAMSLIEDDRSVSTQNRLWYRVTSHAEQEGVEYENIRKSHDTAFADNPPWFDVENQQVWWQCEAPHVNEQTNLRSCILDISSVTTRCNENDCRYDLRIHKNEAVDALTEENNWTVQPEAWLSGSLDLNEQLGGLDQYKMIPTEGIPASIRERKETTIQVIINGDNVEAIGWPYRDELVK